MYILYNKLCNYNERLQVPELFRFVYSFLIYYHVFKVSRIILLNEKEWNPFTIQTFSPK